MPADFDVCYALLQDVTPLSVDCGLSCGGRCCGDTGEDSGMLLFPGERDYLAKWWDASFFQQRPDGTWVFTCDGHCHRHRRPLACRIFPLFPMLSPNGRISAKTDPRAFHVCPLARCADGVRLERAFVRAVRQTGRILTADAACREFIRRQTDELAQWDRLLPHVTERMPIQRRKVK